MTLQNLIEWIENIHDEQPHVSHDWMVSYICARQNYFTRDEVKTAIAATIG